MDRYQTLVQQVADLEAHLENLKAELRQYAEDTDRERAEAEARHRRRGIRALALIPAGVAGGIAVAKNNPIPSAVAGMTASVIIAALVVIPSHGEGIHSTTPGVIAGPELPVPAASTPTQRQHTARRTAARTPDQHAPVSVTAPHAPPQVQTVRLRPVRVPTHQPVDITPVAQPPTKAPNVSPTQACVVDVQLIGLHVPLLCRR
jgi:hypothetical protein